MAEAYSELLIVKQIYKGDSTGMRRGIDSVMRKYGYAGEQELMEKVKTLSAQPDFLRQMLDSTQRRLERIQVEPGDPAPSTPAPANPAPMESGTKERGTKGE